jgi:hypothetical protein
MAPAGRCIAVGLRAQSRRVAARDDGPRRPHGAAGRTRAAGHTTDSDRDDAVARIRDTFAGLPATRFPLLVGHASELVGSGGDERFRFAIDTFLDGLIARATRA